MKTQKLIKKFIIRGAIKGIVMKSNVPINFLSFIDTKKGIVQDSKSNIFKQSIKNKILVFPYAVGSSVGAYSIYSLKSNDVMPNAMLCKNVDLIVSSGCAMANIPLAIISDKIYDKLQIGDKLCIN
ncbi:MAG: DUF126 domain-containing protein [Thaumarchaeota archaeon]|nr:DUF126 domain-containing protein [Nitrososphaerota archaeon]MCY3975913.1 DUF126 domain-containing protein [Nitrososphaerota archaeon]